MTLKFYINLIKIILTSALLGPSTAIDRPPPPEPLVLMVKWLGSPLTPLLRPGP